MLSQLVADWKKESEAKKGLKFLLHFSVWFLALNFFAWLLPLPWVEAVTAELSVWLLALFGTGAEIIFREPVLILLHNHTISISYLCTGLLEAVIIAAAVLASVGISREKRILGAVAGVALTFIFNQARIVATMLAVVNMGLDSAEFLHNLLFRVFLFIVIAGYYALWFWIVTKPAAGRAGKAAGQRKQKQKSGKR